MLPIIYLWKYGEGMNKKLFTMTIITLVIGFMLAVQFQTVKKPKVRDTRDTWELKQALLKEKETELKLLSDIRSSSQKVDEYKSESTQTKEELLQETTAELKDEIGLTEKNGYGIVINVQPVSPDLLMGEEQGSISADLLKRLINELNMYGAKELSIAEHRYINTSVIRDINGETKMNGYPVNNLPLTIKVIASDENSAEQLYNRMKVSQSADDFFMDNLLLDVKKPQQKITIPAYEDNILIRYMKPAGDEEGGGA